MFFQLGAIHAAGFGASGDISDPEMGNGNGDYVPFRNEASPSPNSSPDGADFSPEHKESETVGSLTKCAVTFIAKINNRDSFSLLLL